MFKLFNKTLYCSIFLDSEVRNSTYITKIKTYNAPLYENQFTFFFNLDGHKDRDFMGTMWWYKTEEECLQWIKWNFESWEEFETKNNSVCFKTYSNSVKMLNKKKYLAELFEGKDITKSPLSLDVFDENSLEKYEIKNGIVSSVNPHTKAKRNKNNDVGAEVLSETTKLLYKNIAIHNNQLESFQKYSEANKTIYITIYFTTHLIKYFNSKKRKQSDFYLNENEIAPTIFWMDRIFLNLIYRCNDKSLGKPEVYDELIKEFYNNFVKDTVSIKVFNSKTSDAMKVIKKTEDVAKELLQKDDSLINELINEAIDTFVLKTENPKKEATRTIYFRLNALIDNFDNLLKEI